MDLKRLSDLASNWKNYQNTRKVVKIVVQFQFACISDKIKRISHVAITAALDGALND
jgi:hypothetical protein